MFDTPEGEIIDLEEVIRAGLAQTHYDIWLDVGRVGTIRESDESIIVWSGSGAWRLQVESVPLPQLAHDIRGF